MFGIHLPDLVIHLFLIRYLIMINTIKYTITVTNPAGCTVVDTLLVKMKTETNTVVDADLFVPKGWTPNGDGHNDKLSPLTLHIKELRYFRVFNRWGQLVFETNVLGFGWDGTI